MSTSHYYRLYSGHENVGRVLKEPFWKLISRLAEQQKVHPELIGRLEYELEWVDVTDFIMVKNRREEEERWLHRMVRTIESSANGVPAKTYVVPFRGSLPGEVVFYNGIPEHVCFIRVHGAEPYPMPSLRNDHLVAQHFYSTQLAKPPQDAVEKILRFLASLPSLY